MSVFCRESRGRDAFVSLLREDAGKRIYRVIPVDSPVREKAIQMFASHPLEEYRHGMLELGSSLPDLVPAFRALDLPVLGLCGSDDPYPDQPEGLAGKKNFREAPSIAGAGRFVHWERPSEFNAIVAVDPHPARFARRSPPFRGRCTECASRSSMSLMHMSLRCELHMREPCQGEVH
jgi:hypothetical protein